MMKLYKEHGVNPAGGCLPLIVQFPVFIVLYGVIRGLTHTVTQGKKIIAEPDYISKSTRLYKDLVASNGHIKAFGIDLANNLFSHHSSWVLALPYGGLVAVAIALQYLQMRQLNNRNPAAAQANPQVQMMQKYMPLVFAIIYIRISAGVNIYFVVSSLCRIGIQEAIFRSGLLNKPAASRAEVLPSHDGSPGKPKKKTFMEKLADMQQQALEQQRARQAALQADSGHRADRRQEGSTGAGQADGYRRHQRGVQTGGRQGGGVETGVETGGDEARGTEAAQRGPAPERAQAGGVGERVEWFWVGRYRRGGPEASARRERSRRAGKRRWGRQDDTVPLGQEAGEKGSLRDGMGRDHGPDGRRGEGRSPRPARRGRDRCGVRSRGRAPGGTVRPDAGRGQGTGQGPAHEPPT